MASAQESSPRPAGLLVYPRHFLLLAGLGIWLAVITRLYLLSNLDASFAAYGAFHASALVLSLRARGSIASRCRDFVVVGAGLSVLTLHAGMLALHWLGRLPGNSGLYQCDAWAFTAGAGAVSYGCLTALVRPVSIILKGACRDGRQLRHRDICGLIRAREWPFFGPLAAGRGLVVCVLRRSLVLGPATSRLRDHQASAHAPDARRRSQQLSRPTAQPGVRIQEFERPGHRQGAAARA